jgi:hypothetical protein
MISKPVTASLFEQRLEIADTWIRFAFRNPFKRERVVALPAPHLRPRAETISLKEPWKESITISASSMSNRAVGVSLPYRCLITQEPRTSRVSGRSVEAITLESKASL